MSSSSEAPLKDSSRDAAATALRGWKQLLAARNLEEFAAAWLAAAGSRVGALRGVLVVRKPGAERFAPAGFLPAGQPCGTFLADVAERALMEARPAVIEADGGGAFGIAVPVELGRQLQAIAAFEWAAPPDRHEDLLREVQWGVPWVERFLAHEAGEHAGGKASPALAIAREVLAAARFGDAARAAATGLALAFDCERVAVGLRSGARVELAALSNTAMFDARLALPRAIGEAIGEALREGAPLRHPAGDGQSPAAALARLADERAGGSVACVPAAGFGFCLERREKFGDEALRDIGAACSVLAPMLELQHANEVSLGRRAWNLARAGMDHWFGTGAGARRVGALAVLLALAVLSFAEGQFRVAGDAALEGSVRRVMTAPFDGYVREAQVRAGDLVKQGAPIAALDDRDLRLERVRAASQHAQYARQIQEAAARHDRGQMQILQAQLAQAQAQIELLDEQLGRARLAAPFDGMVVSGDLSQSIGSAVRKGDTLFEVAPLTGYRVVVQVDEGEIAAVAEGQKGTLLLAAITDRSFAFSVTLVTPVARSREGRNSFRVEGVLEDTGERLRPGMEGVAKIEAGPRNLVWIWTHRFTNWLRLWLWGIWP